MFLYTKLDREGYLSRGDWVFDLLSSFPQLGSEFASHKWLLNSPEKRSIYEIIYGDLISKGGKKILDVGGGFCSISNILIKKNDYQLLDIMAHDDTELLKDAFWINSDWNSHMPKEKYDVIIANDLFPNVDQRLEEFLDKYLPHCDEMRLSLTFYNNKRSYKVKRVDADEIFHILAWDNMRLLRSLEKYKEKIENYDSSALLTASSSVFNNGRHVCIINLKNKKEKNENY